MLEGNFIIFFGVVQTPVRFKIKLELKGKKYFIRLDVETFSFVGQNPKYKFNFDNLNLIVKSKSKEPIITKKLRVIEPNSWISQFNHNKYSNTLKWNRIFKFYSETPILKIDFNLILNSNLRLSANQENLLKYNFGLLDQTILLQK